MTTDADPDQAPTTGADAGASGAARRWLRRPLASLRSASLARRFLFANLAIMLVAGVAVGIWVGDQLERSIVDRTASVTALYVESIIEPSVGSMARGFRADPGGGGHARRPPRLQPARGPRALIALVVAQDGRVVYSPDAALIGRTFPVEGNLALAWEGDVVTSMDDLSGEENAWERARWSRLLEIYIPVRERGSDRIIAVAEFYLPPREIDQQVGEARWTTWLLVSLVIIVSAVLLYGLVKRGSDTIAKQEVALTKQVDELTTVLDENAVLSARVRSAARRTTMLNERTMRRVSSDLHDGPGQMLSLALLRLDRIQKRAEAGQPPSAAELAEIEDSLQDAMTDMRAVAAGLRVPELAPLDVEAVVARAAADHERRTGARVEVTLERVDGAVSLPVKIALYRALQESLSNATRHGGTDRIRVAVSGTPAPGGGRPLGLELGVSDDGSGFDPATLASSDGLGLAGIREGAEILGGSFSVHSVPGEGTRLEVWWPRQERGNGDD